MSTVKSSLSVESMVAEAYLVCRDLGHQWCPLDVSISKKYREVRRELRCSGCQTIRVQVLTLDGYLTGRSYYRYPEQLDPDAEPYVMKGVGRLSSSDRAAIRVVSIQRMKGTK